MILIVDDDQAIRSSLTFLLKRAKYEPHAVSSPKEAIAFVREQTPELILMDMNYSLTTTGEEGIFLLKQVKLFCPDTPVILMTAWGSIQLAVEGMRAGAFDFVTKPWNNIGLLQTIQTAIEINSRHKEFFCADFTSDAGADSGVEATLAESAGSGSHSGLLLPGIPIVGKSKALRDVLETVKRIAPTHASVLITGESGTGKELIAEALHRLSLRASAPFVKVNLGGISQSLFESEMFGHKKGAFTDAYSDRTGRFQLADKGTIFLDEIGDLDMNCQVKLLRVLQDQTFEVLGESRPRRTDVRVVCATNRNLKQMVAEHTFREDLYYRISLIPVHLPPLRERVADIPLLAAHFARSISEQSHTAPAFFTPAALDYLQRLPYPGNIRELKNLVERVILMSGKIELDETDVQAVQEGGMACGAAMAGAGGKAAGSSGLTPLERLEKAEVERVLVECENNISRAAKMLGMSRAALYRRLEKYR